MKKFKVTAKFVTYCTVEILANTEDDAYLKAKQMDGGDFEPHGHGDWEIYRVQEVAPVLTREQIAFLDSYCNSVADATREEVVEFLQFQTWAEGDEFIERHGTGTYSSIMDAYCVWNNAMEFAKTIAKNNE